MKKYIFGIIIAIMAISSCQEDFTNDHMPFNIEDIKSKSDVNIYISKETIKPSTEIEVIGGNITSPDFESWLVFIDLHPFANWMHPCQYIFINAKTGKRTVIDGSFPPNIISEMEILKEVPYDTNGELFNFDDIVQTRAATNANNLWAVIISGGINANNNHVRYWNDCAAMYNILTKKYGYRKDRIFVIMADGTNPAADRKLLNGTFDSSPLDLDGDGLPDIQYAATRSNITNVFNHLSTRVTTKDELFIFTMDHGARNNYNSALCLWNNELLYDNEFANLINKINAKSINIVMGQCHSGGFIDHLKGNNRVIATACAANELSYSTSNRLYDEFVYHWMSAVNEKTIDSGASVLSDANKDGYVTAKESFNYAKKNDRQLETPQYSSIGSLGDKLTLSGIISNPVRTYYAFSDYGIVSDITTKIYNIEDLRNEPVVINVTQDNPLFQFVRWEYENPFDQKRKKVLDLTSDNGVLINNKHAETLYRNSTSFYAIYKYIGNNGCTISISNVSCENDAIKIIFSTSKVTKSTINMPFDYRGFAFTSSRAWPMGREVFFDGKGTMTLESGKNSWIRYIRPVFEDQNVELFNVDRFIEIQYTFGFTDFEDGSFYYTKGEKLVDVLRY